MKSKCKTKAKDKKTLTDWDWTTLVAAWRYYEHRHTIAACSFPHDVVQRFFTDGCDKDDCMRIAGQFTNVDHYKGPDDKYSGWIGDDAFGDCYREAWRLFYWFMYAYAHDGFVTKRVRTPNGCEGDVECFKSDGKWYAKEGYLRYGERVAPYQDDEIVEITEEVK